MKATEREIREMEKRKRRGERKVANEDEEREIDIEH